MRKAIIRHVLAVIVPMVLAAPAASAADTKGEPCRIIEREPGVGDTLSSSVTVGGGTAATTVQSGKGSHTTGSSVSVQSGNGSSSSVAAASGDGTTVVTGADGDCVIVREPNK